MRDDRSEGTGTVPSLPDAGWLDVEDARATIAVVDAGGFRAAGSATGIDVGTISRRVARLERRLGVTVIHRSSRRIEVSGAGVAALASLRELVAAHRTAEAALRRVAGGAVGVLRVAVDRGLGPADRAAARRYVAEMDRRLPGWVIVVVRAFGPAARRALGRGGVDLVLGRGYVGPGLRHAALRCGPGGLRVAWAGGWRGPAAEAAVDVARADGSDRHPARRGAVPGTGRVAWGRPGSRERGALAAEGPSPVRLRAAAAVPLLTESAAWPRSPT